MLYIKVLVKSRDEKHAHLLCREFIFITLDGYALKISLMMPSLSDTMLNSLLLRICFSSTALIIGRGMKGNRKHIKRDNRVIIGPDLACVTDTNRIATRSAGRLKLGLA